MAILIYNCTAVLMDDENTILKNAFITVEGTQIAAIGTMRPIGSFEQMIDAQGGILMPGLVNAHTHLPMTLMRGYGGGCDLQTWLSEYIFPAEDKLDARAVRAGCGLALAELIASGVTTVADMYMFCEEITQEVVSAGISANIARGATLFGDHFDFETHPACRETRDLVERWHGWGDGQILVDACVHGEYTSHPVLWQAMSDYAAEHNLGMHVHVSETRKEQDECLARWGKTPAQILDDYGVWNTRAIAAHGVWLTDADMELFAKRGVTLVHNPVSNLKLGSGIARICAMRDAGINVALGTDGVSSNNSHDMFEEIKLASILQNGSCLNPSAISPIEALRMATVNGGKALGRKTGKIATGYTADLILLDCNRPHLLPQHSILDLLAYSAHGSDVVMNMARGKIIYRDGVFLTLDLARIRMECERYALPLLFDDPYRS
ncbi:MAG: amidohydrolase [Evtepia sp.]